METSPIHHSFLLDHQCLSSPSPTTTIHNMTKTGCKRRKKQKKNDDDEDIMKKLGNCKGELGDRGYIHVRARRGEATDSHSLAERARREKISEKMKTLQAIVPGCDKITGKAHMLDEVISYVHSLQNEVQILSLKLASVNPMLYEFEADFDAFMHESHQNTSNYQEQQLLFQEHQMPSISQNNAEILLEWGEQRQELDPFSSHNSFNSFQQLAFPTITS